MPAPTDRPPDEPTAIFDGAFRMVVVLAVILAGLTLLRMASDAGGRPLPDSGGVAGTSPSLAPSGAASPVDVAAYLEPIVRAAPPLELEGPDGTLSLASLRGTPVLVFFGYTHCPDVCPATIGTVGMAIDAYGGDARAVLVSVDPERDTPAWLTEFERYLPAGFNAVSGSPAAVRATADAWSVRYARVETDDPGVYLMSHTADVFVVDGDGQLRARLPFGTDAPTMAAVLRAVETAPTAASSSPPASPQAQPSPTMTPTDRPLVELHPMLVSSSVWAGGASPVIFTLDDVPEGEQVTARQVGGPGGRLPALAVRPDGIAQVSYVATVDIPSPGPWRLEVRSATGVGSFEVTALDPGGTAALGAPAPAVATQTADDVDTLTWLTTDPLPNPRLYGTGTSEALAAGTPFVFVVDSYSFKVTPQCGQAVVMAKTLLDRWPGVPFIHHEPYRYTVVTTEPVLEGTLEAPRLTDVALAWGVGEGSWGVESMPWIFVVDGEGRVRAKYQGVMGSADVDVLLTMLMDQARTALWPGQNGPRVPLSAPSAASRVPA